MTTPAEPDDAPHAAAPSWPLQRFGKHWGLRRLADRQGVFAMVAIDQRPPIEQCVARARGIAPEAVGFDDIVRVKALLAAAMAPHASALLVDPDFGLPAAAPHLQPAARRGMRVPPPTPPPSSASCASCSTRCARRGEGAC